MTGTALAARQRLLGTSEHLDSASHECAPPRQDFPLWAFVESAQSHTNHTVLLHNNTRSAGRPRCCCTPDRCITQVVLLLVGRGNHSWAVHRWPRQQGCKAPHCPGTDRQKGAIQETGPPEEGTQASIRQSARPRGQRAAGQWAGSR